MSWIWGSSQDGDARRDAWRTAMERRLAEVLRRPDIQSWIYIAIELKNNNTTVEFEGRWSAAAALKAARDMSDSAATRKDFLEGIIRNSLEDVSPTPVKRLLYELHDTVSNRSPEYQGIVSIALALAERLDKLKIRVAAEAAEASKRLVEQAEADKKVLQRRLKEKEAEMEELRQMAGADREALLQKLEDKEATMEKLRQEAAADAKASSNVITQAEAEKEVLQRRLEEKEAEMEHLVEAGVQMRALGVQDMVRRSAEEEKQENVSPLDFYDVIIDVPGLQDVYTGPGWAVSYKKPESFDDFQANTNAISVSIIGDFNVGKSYILSQLSGHTFQSGDRVHTIGISIKKMNLGQRSKSDSSVGKQAFFLDTQGLNSPGLGPLPDFSLQKDRQHQHVAHERWIQEMQAAEEFQRQVILGVANIFFFVVGQLSLKNQKDLLMLHKAITQMKRTKKSLAAQRIFVLHNLRDWTHKQFMEFKYMEKIQDHYGKNHLEIECREEGCFSFLMGELGTNENDLVKVEHLFLTKDGASNCQNHHVFDFLKKVLEVAPVDKMNMCQRIKGAMAEWLPSYVQVVSSRRSFGPALQIDEHLTTAEDLESDLHHLRQEGRKMAWIRAVHDAESKESLRVSVKCRPLGALVTLASDDLPFNLSECPCTIITKRGPQDRMLRILSIEVPGLVLENFTCLREARAADGAPDRNPPNLMLSKMVDDDDESLRVELTAELRTTPVVMNEQLDDGEKDDQADGNSNTIPLTSKFSLASHGELLGMEKYTCRVLDKGSRAIDSGRHSRVVNFQYSFSHKDLRWDDNFGPYYCYQDGVLAIGFVQRGKANAEKIEEFALSIISELPLQPVPDTSKVEAIESVPRPGTSRLEALLQAEPRSPGPETEVCSQSTAPWIELP